MPNDTPGKQLRDYLDQAVADSRVTRHADGGYFFGTDGPYIPYVAYKRLGGTPIPRWETQ